jgi:hypothetical protein
MKHKIIKIEEIIDIPPFSIDKLSHGKKYRKKEYIEYIENALTTIHNGEIIEKRMRASKERKIQGQVAIFLRFYCKSNRLNLNNLFDPMLDIFIQKGWIQDRSCVYILRGQKVLVGSIEEQKIEVTIIKL